MANLSVLVSNRVAPESIDFPAECERSREGALYIRPSSTLMITPDEWEHINKSRPDLAAKLQVQPLRLKPKKSVESKATRKAGSGSGRDKSEKSDAQK